MRLIDRFPTATVRPRSTRRDRRPQFAVDSAAPNASPEPTHRKPVNTPMTRPRSRTQVRCARRSTRVLLVVELAALALVLTASSAHAELAQIVAQPPTPPTAPTGGVTDVLDRIRTWIMGILAGLATVFLSIGGVRYVMGGGDPGEVEKAKTAFKSAGWGYGLAALAPVVMEILKGIVGA